MSITPRSTTTNSPHTPEPSSWLALKVSSDFVYIPLPSRLLSFYFPEEKINQPLNSTTSANNLLILTSDISLDDFFKEYHMLNVLSSFLPTRLMSFSRDIQVMVVCEYFTTTFFAQIRRGINRNMLFYFTMRVDIVNVPVASFRKSKGSFNDWRGY